LEQELGLELEQWTAAEWAQLSVSNSAQLLDFCLEQRLGLEMEQRWGQHSGLELELELGLESELWRAAVWEKGLVSNLAQCLGFVMEPRLGLEWERRSGQRLGPELERELDRGSGP
jgi:hypothetical protein